MGLRFGTDDHLQCITFLPGGERNAIFPGEPLCLGYKFTVKWFGLPYRTTNDGYVLMPGEGGHYLRLDQQRIAELQESHLLPTPLPAYEVPVGWRMAGYGLWALVAGVAAAIAITALWRRRLARIRVATPLSTSGPVIAKDGDRELQAGFRDLLEPGEVITHQALTYDRPTTEKHVKRQLAALTDRRLLISTTNVGVFGLGRRAPTKVAITRADIEWVKAKDELLAVKRRGSDALLPLVVASVPRGFTTANQRAFLFDLPRLLSPGDRVELPEARVVR